MGDLRRLALATVGCAPQHPVVLPTHRITRPPEFRGDAGVGGIFEHITQPAIADLPRNFGAKLEVQSLVVDAPALVRFHVDTLFRVGDEVFQGPVTGFQADVGHANQGDAVPAAGAHGAVGLLLPQLLCGLPAGQVAHEDALTHDGGPLGRHTLIVVAEGAQPARQRRVGGDVDVLRTVSEAPELVGGEKRCAGISCFGTEHPVQLDGVATRLVNLQRHLGPVEDHGGHAAGALPGAQQRHGLLSGALRIARQVHGFDKPVAGCALMPAKGVGIRTLLHVAVARRRALHAAAGFDDRLLDERTLGVGKPLVFADALHAGLGHHNAINHLHVPCGCYEHTGLLFQRHLEGVDFHRRDVGVYVRDRWPQFNGPAFHPRTGLGDSDGLACCFLDLSRRDHRAGREAPGPIDKHPHSEASTHIL